MKRIILFFGACLVLAIAPGPDNCFVLAQSAAQGCMAGLAVTAGLMSGVCVHIVLAILGLATVLNRYPKATHSISLLGGAYLLWVAWGMAQSGMAEVSAEPLSLGALYLRGVILNLSNPKVILFFVAFLPRFLPAGCEGKGRKATLHLLLLGGLFIIAASTIMSSIALVGGGLASYLKSSPTAALWVNRFAAGAVAAIALSIFYTCAKDLHRK